MSLSPKNIKLTEKEIYTQLYNGLDQLEIENEIKSIYTNEGVCGKVIENGLFCYSCPVCKKINDAILCQECYQAGNHIGHNAELIRDLDYGTCDCGDFDLLKENSSCPAHAGYLDESKISHENLPIRIRENCVKTLDFIMKTLNSICIQIERESKSSLFDNKNLISIVYVIGHLAKNVSPIFINLISQRFKNFYMDEIVVHKCGINKFISACEKENFDKLLAEHKITELSVRQLISENKPHKCICSLLDNFMRIQHNFSEDLKKFISHTLFSALMRNKSMKFYMSIAYFSNYGIILQNCENTSYELAAQSIQFLGYPEFAEIILQTPEIISIMLEERARIINQIYKTKSITKFTSYTNYVNKFNFYTKYDWLLI